MELQALQHGCLSCQGEVLKPAVCSDGYVQVSRRTGVLHLQDNRRGMGSMRIQALWRQGRL